MVNIGHNISVVAGYYQCEDKNIIYIYIYMYLVGGLEHEFYDFPFSWEFHNP